MSITEKEKGTISYYDENAKGYADHLKGKNLGFFLPKKAEIFKKLLPKGKVIEIGCGTGNEARLLIEHGYEYTGIDVSKEMIKEAEKLNLNAKFHNISAYDVDALDEIYDGFWANLSLVHIPKNRTVEVLNKIRKVVRKGGIGYISLKVGELEGVDPKGRFVAHYSLPEFTKIIEETNFTIEDSEMIEGGDRKFISFIVRV